MLRFSKSGTLVLSCLLVGAVVVAVWVGSRSNIGDGPEEHVPLPPEWIKPLISKLPTRADFEAVRLRLLRARSDGDVFAGLVSLSSAMDPQLRALAAFHLAHAYPLAAHYRVPVEEALSRMSQVREVWIRRRVVKHLAMYDTPFVRQILIDRIEDDEPDYMTVDDSTTGQVARRAIEERGGQLEVLAKWTQAEARKSWIGQATESVNAFQTTDVRLGRSQRVRVERLASNLWAELECSKIYSAAFAALNGKTSDFSAFRITLVTSRGGLVGATHTAGNPTFGRVTLKIGSDQVEVWTRVISDDAVRFWIRSHRESS